MEAVYALARLVHIAWGSLALLTGPVAMLTSGTRRSHRVWGQGYLALVVALVLSGMVLLGRLWCCCRALVVRRLVGACVALR
jgi:hypothetical protein